jgi:NADH dehydrogenase FAD-containing subunit
MHPQAHDGPKVLFIDAIFSGLNFHLFQPMLYQVATASFDVNVIAAATRDLFRRQSNVAAHTAEIDRADAQ